MKYKSVAIWPNSLYLGNPDGSNKTEDTHNNKQEAISVCKMIENRGFGGLGEVFPLSVYYEKVEK